MIGRELSPAQLDRLVAWTLGLAPALLFLLTWSDEFSPMQQMARALALPVLAAELVVVILSFGEGYRLGRLPAVPLALLAALGILVWGTAITAADPVPAILRSGTWTIHLLFALAIVNLQRQGLVDFNQVLRALLIGFLLFFALLVAFIVTTEQTNTERIFELPAFGHVRWFGYYAAAAIGLSAGGFLRGNRFALLTASLGFAMAFWTGTRGTVAAAVVGLLVCAILFHRFRSPRAWLLFVLCGLAGSAVALGLDTLAPFGNLGPDSMARFGSTGRIDVWRDTLEKILERPLFGWGEGQFRFSGGAMTIAQPHNIILQVLHAWGLLGGLLCLALAVWTALRFVKVQTVEAAPFQCAALILAAYSFIDGPLYYVQSTSLFALCCAATIGGGMRGST